MRTHSNRNFAACLLRSVSKFAGRCFYRLRFDPRNASSDTHSDQLQILIVLKIMKTLMGNRANGSPGHAAGDTLLSCLLCVIFLGRVILKPF